MLPGTDVALSNVLARVFSQTGSRSLFLEISELPDLPFSSARFVPQSTNRVSTNILALVSAVELAGMCLLHYYRCCTPVAVIVLEPGTN